HPSVAVTLDNLAMLLDAKGDVRGVEPLVRRALAIDEKVLGPDDPEVAMCLNNLAGLLYNNGDYAGAEPLYRRALAIREKSLRADHPDIAVSLKDLGMLLAAKGDHAGAEAAVERGLSIEDARALTLVAAGSDRQKQWFFVTLSDSTTKAISLHLQDGAD